MPVRSLNSSVLRWPDPEEVISALERWISKLNDPNVLKVGYFGSYARGNWGVGSDLDVVIIVRRADVPFERRSALFDLSEIPVPVDLFVYTEDEWRSIGNRFDRVIWLKGRFEDGEERTREGQKLRPR